MAAAAFVCLVGCSSTPPPTPLLDALAEAAERTPVVLVPGITGVELRDRATGKIVWGTGANLVKPKDGGRSGALPIDPRAAAASTIEAGEVLERLKLFGLFTVEVYSTIVRLLEHNGYRRGDLLHPRPGENLFLFAYDWRRDNLDTVRLLAERLSRLRQALGLKRLRVALLCQSNGGQICRYFAKYGVASLESAEAGRVERPPGIEVSDVILLGTSNGGALRILREMNRGRKYLIWPLGRRFQPETLFTYRSLYQDLPAGGDGLFLDESGRSLDVDIYDADEWKRYGWSIYAAKAGQRVARKGRREVFGDAEARAVYLARVLDRAVRLHRVPRRDVEDFGASRYHLIQSSEHETPAKALLIQGKKGWRTLFSGDPRLDRLEALRELASVPGDGHATLESQLWLSPQESERLVGGPFYVEGEHFDLIEATATHERLLEILLRSRSPGRR